MVITILAVISVILLVITGFLGVSTFLFLKANLLWIVILGVAYFLISRRSVINRLIGRK